MRHVFIINPHAGKRDHTARQLLRAMHPGQEGLCIRLTNPSDLSGFVRYMMEASYD